MPDIELEAPDLDDVDEGAPTFTRRLALVVVLITLFGSLVAYLQTVESNKEENAARDAQIFSIEGLGDQVDATASLAAGIRVISGREILLEREAINTGRVVQSPANSGLADRYLAAAQRYAAMRDAIAPLLPVSGEEPIGDEPDEDEDGSIDTGGGTPEEQTFDEPVDILELSADLDVGPDEARLRQAVQADLANDHGGKADTFVAVLTVLAVALFLIGLSLTVQGRTRVVLAAPGMFLAVVCVLWTGFVLARPVTDVSDDSIELTAEGQRQIVSQNFDAAIEALDEAIEDSPDFAAAFALRGDAFFQQGSPQIGRTSFISVTTPEALEKAIDDLERALELGADSDLVTVAGLAFFLFVDGDFERSARLSEDAIELNDQRPEVWFNLGVAEIANGNEREARRAYREGMDLLTDDRDAFGRGQTLAGARTDLSILREVVDNDDLDDADEIASDIEAELAAFEQGLSEPPCPDDVAPCPSADEVAADAGASAFTFRRDGSTVFGRYDLTGVEAQTTLTHVWYFRANDDEPFSQTVLPTEISRLIEPIDFDESFTVVSADPECPLAGEFKLEVFAGDRLLGSGTGVIEPGVLGEPFTAFTDPIEGIDLCVPDGFEVQVQDIEGGGGDQFTAFFSEETGTIFGVNAFPGAFASDIDPLTVEREAVRGVAGQNANIQEATLTAQTVDGAFFQLTASSATFDTADGTGIIVSSVGPDGVLRTALLLGSTDAAVMQEFLDVLIFTGLPAGSDA